VSNLLFSLFSDKRGLSLRAKFLFIVVAIVSLPWMGIRYVNEMKSFLLQGQEDALLLTAKAVGTVLNERDELFRPDTGVPELLGGTNDVYAHQLESLLQVDGDPIDWGSQLDTLRDFTGTLGQECTSIYEPHSLSVRHTLGFLNEFLYALFMVDDDVVLYRADDLRRLDHSDQLRMTIKDSSGEIFRYLLITRKSGRMSVYLMDKQWRYPLTGEPVSNINAVMVEVDGGYNIELRLPRRLIDADSRLGFDIVDVDSPEIRLPRDMIKTYPEADDEQLSRVMILSPEIARILGGLNTQIARIWILDTEQRVRAVVGNPGTNIPSKPESRSFFDSFGNGYNRLFDWLLQMPSDNFRDVETSESHRSDIVITKALNGEQGSRRRLSLDNRAEILVAAYPILSAGSVIGAVVVEQSSTEVLKLQDKALKSVAAVTLAAFLLITFAIFIFASRLTIRIRRLHFATEQAITSKGRVRNEYVDAFPKSTGGDEINELSHSITSMLGRLSQYTRYLEAMPDTLAHELNNPLNVVSSSLEILSNDSKEAGESKYMHRARKGLQRLRSILTSLTEAANLEEALEYEHREDFDLVDLVDGCTEGYQISFPNHLFILNMDVTTARISGNPDRIAQLLDKLVDNAVDFGEINGEIRLGLSVVDNMAYISVTNTGSSLPEEMKDRLFDPMVSVGSKDATQSHLGLGLFVARIISEYHHGTIEAENLPDAAGVTLTVGLPLVATKSD
jgi:two-component system, OmpR family, sensor histidine kinase ChvG